MRWLAPFVIAALAGTALADDSKLGKEDVPIQPKSTIRGKNKLCCGYPLVDDLQWALRFYWLTQEADYQEVKGQNIPRGGACAIAANRYVEVYTKDGLYMGRIQERFACSLALEGSALMMDGRVFNYAGYCKQGYGLDSKRPAICFEQLDVKQYPFGRGAGTRPLIPFKSVAVDPRVIAIGEPIYVPEFDGMVLPDGSIHDGCVRADDTGGGIKKRKMDFFVVTYGNFRFLLDQLLGVSWITPHIESPRCEYLRDM
jgi:hypothetical protein